MRFFIFSVLFLGSLFSHAQNDYFFPKQSSFDPNIPTPQQFLGHAIGEHQTRYDRLVAYMYELDRLSDKVLVSVIGESLEKRPQIIVMISSAANLAKLPLLQSERFKLRDPATPLPDLSKMPVLVQLGANVHGNETSGGEAMILAAYYLAAANDEATRKMLDESVIFIEPVLNPDGRDRFVSWVNQNKGTPLVADPNDREHNETWPGGRTNHYWFDLNRDWYLAVHQESQNRLKFYHQWLPNVVTDHHEMGTNSTFFFEPSKENAENPYVPAYVYKTLNTQFAKYYEKALNGIGSLYYTKESFDNLYPGYGSSYPDLQGGLGILFEQGSSRGMMQESQHGPVTFAFTIRNQLLCALATCQAAVDERQNLLKFQREFFATALSEANKNAVKGYVVGDAHDATRVRKFAQMLMYHNIEAYQLASDLTIDGKTFEKGKALIVPTAQPQYRMILSMFEKPTKFADSLFYDASAWNMPLAFGLPHAELKSNFTKGLKVGEDFIQTNIAAPSLSSYSYLLDYSDYMATKALYQLLEQNILVKVAQRTFKIGDKTYPHGSLLIPVEGQKMNKEALYEAIKNIGKSAGVSFVGIPTGFSQSGIDLGSNNFQKVQKPEALLVVGQGVSAYEAGEVWYWLDTHVGLPISKVDVNTLSRVNLGRYNVIVMVSGNYDRTLSTKIKQWVAAGGTLITFKTATEWAIRNDLTKEKLRPLIAKTDSASLPKRRINYEDAAAAEGSKNTGGTMFEADLDITHPIGYGYRNRKITLYRNNNTLLEPSASPYHTVVQYTDKPYLTGYVHPQTLKKISSSAGVLVAPEGSGRVILFADNPNFRGIWYSTNKLFLNAIFFGANISSPNPFGHEK
ncbi:MAG: M14 family zinc carboxypeptidase [Runella sp.]